METITDTSILDQIPFSIFIKDLKSIYLYSNLVNARYSEHTPEEITGKTDFDLFPEAAAEKYRKDDSVVVESGKSSDRIEFIEHNNEEIILRIIKSPFRNEKGEIIGVMGVYWEITEELRDKAALSDNRSQLRLALKAGEIGVWNWDFKQKKLFWDEQVNKIFGIPGIYQGERSYFIDFIHPEEREIVSERLMISDMSETEINTDFRIIRPDGSVRYVQTRGEVHGDRNNNPEKVIGVIHDITQKRLTRETLHSIVELNQSVDRLSMEEIQRQLLKEAVRLTDSRIGFLYFVHEDNSLSLKNYLISGEEDNTAPENHRSSAATGILDTCIREQHPIIHNSCDSEECFAGIPGKTIPMNRELTVPIIKDSAVKALIRVGNKPGIYEISDVDQLSLLGENTWNIIIRKQMVHSLEVAHEEALKSNKIKDRFFSIIAHDLTNPISNIRILSDHFTTLISEPSPDIDTLRELSLILGKSVITAQELLKNLLTWSRAQRNALEYQPETLSAEIPLDMAIEECKPIAEGKNITISSSRDPGISVYADSNMLQTILRNLLVNAIKFSSVGGEIILKLTEENNSVHYSIEDFGTGMNEETVSSLFRIDERKSTAGTNSEKGTGLGLILCKEFIDSHDGKIEVESQPGKGSRFTVILPGIPAA